MNSNFSQRKELPCPLNLVSIIKLNKAKKYNIRLT